MGTKNVVLMKMARESLKGKWSVAVSVALVFLGVSFLTSFIDMISPLDIGGIVSLFITGPFILGLTIFSLAISRNQEFKFEQIFQGFNHFWKSVGAYLLMVLYILLWTILLIIPGIIAGISYSMTFYIIADDKSIKIGEALRKSKAMMNGYKWKFFRLQLRFIGWALLCILTLGVGFLWLIPYIQVSISKFYDDIKYKKILEEVPAEPEKV